MPENCDLHSSPPCHRVTLIHRVPGSIAAIGQTGKEPSPQTIRIYHSPRKCLSPLTWGMLEGGIPLSRQGQSRFARFADLTVLPQMPTILWHLESEPWYRLDADECQHIRTSKEERTP